MTEMLTEEQKVSIIRANIRTWRQGLKEQPTNCTMRLNEMDAILELIECMAETIEILVKEKNNK